MDLRSLFATKRRVLVAILALAVVSGGAAVALGVLGTPSVTGIDNRFGGVNETTTVVESDIHVSNPNPLGAQLGGLTVDYAIDMNGIRMANGTKEGVSIDRGQSTVPLTTYLANERIPAWWVSHIENGEQTTLAVNADVHAASVGASFGAPKVQRSIDTDLISQFNSTEPRPVNANKPLVSDPVLYINETRAEWGSVNRSVTPVRLTFVVYNPKPYPVPVSELGYDISMNDVDVGTGDTEGYGTIPPGDTRTIETTTYIRNPTLDEWWVSHLRRNQTTDLRIDFSLVVEIQGESVRIPMDALTYTKTIETDIFDNKPDGDAGGETATATPTATPTATSTPTPTSTAGGLLGDDQTATETPTPTPTPTETATDGGLFGDGETTTPTNETATPTSTPSPTPTSSPTPTDDGLLDLLSI